MNRPGNYNFFVLLLPVIFVLSLSFPARSAGTAASSYETQLFLNIEQHSRPFYKKIQRIIYGKGYMEVESQSALIRMVKWLDDNKYPRINEFLDALDDDDSLKLLNCFKTKKDILSTDYLPIVEADKSSIQLTPLSLPFKGVYYVVQGNSGNISHFKDSSNEFAWDFVIMKDGFMYKGATHKNKNYYAWGTNVIAPAPGKVVKCRSDMPDHRPMTTKMDGANYVVIEHAENEHSLIYHLMKDSLTVSAGDTVKQGEIIGRVGDSGISMFPHIHYQLDSGTGENRKTMNARFSCYFARTDSEPSWRLMISQIPVTTEYVINVNDYLDMLAEN